MPYYLETDDRTLLRKLLQTNGCSVCSGKLEAYWDVVKKLPYLQCHDHPEHEGIAKEYREPRELNIPTRRKEMAEQHGEKTTTALEKTRLPTAGALTESQAMHILKLVYPNAPNDEIVRCAILCRDFGLHPLLKEVYIIPFGQGDKRTWSTVMGINATRKLMAQRGSFSYIDNTPRVMTTEEQKQIFGEVDNTNIYAITKLKTKTGLEAQGYGMWPKDREPYGTDKGNTKANMAFIRSERNAFGRLYPDAKLPNIDIVDEVYAEVPDIGKVSNTTGEITEQLTEPELLLGELSQNDLIDTSWVAIRPGLVRLHTAELGWMTLGEILGKLEHLGADCSSGKIQDAYETLIEANKLVFAQMIKEAIKEDK